MVSGTQPPVPVKSSCSRPAIKPSHWWSQSEASDQPLWLAEGKAGEASLVSGWRGQGSQLGGGGPGGSGQWPGGGSQLASWRPRARTSLVKFCSIKGKNNCYASLTMVWFWATLENIRFAMWKVLCCHQKQLFVFTGDTLYYILWLSCVILQGSWARKSCCDCERFLEDAYILN